jgi:hypothetical protein
MAIRLLSDGTFEFDTVSEAVEFQRMAKAENGAPRTPKTSSRPPVVAQTDDPAPPTPDIAGFAAALAGNRKRLLDALAGADGEVTTDELGNLAGVKSGAVGPLLRHIRDTAERHGLDRKCITTRKIPRGPGGRQVSYYRLSDELKRGIQGAPPQQ